MCIRDRSTQSTGTRTKRQMDQDGRVDVEKWLMDHASKRGKSNMVQFIMEQGGHSAPTPTNPPKADGRPVPAPQDLPRSKHDQELLIRLTKEVDSLRKCIQTVEEERTALAERATISTKEMLEERSTRIVMEAKMKELEAYVKAQKKAADTCEAEKAAREQNEEALSALQREHKKLSAEHQELKELQSKADEEKQITLRGKQLIQERHDELECELEACRGQLLDTDNQLEESQLKCHKLQETLKLYICLLYTSDAADEEDSVDLGGRRIIKKKKKNRVSM
eukprot:TRINITY_DN12070_c0_g1_i1.p1 TRINITY_DN12070_c0_g1~~TRINITY_DN12070_c0_g1_i1.p1  ORF type:complete len:280 (-),score=80.53 TRINITY_DN12070_c0_g1_i1:58-897(-)